jgi:hypothetical protein
MTTESKPAACLLSAVASYGTEEENSWDAGADGWTFELRTEYGTEEFSYWLGRGHKGREPEVSELVLSLVSDAQYLENEPEEVSWLMGQKISANNEKMTRLFGSYWQQLLAMSEEEIAEVF